MDDGTTLTLKRDQGSGATVLRVKRGENDSTEAEEEAKEEEESVQAWPHFVEQLYFMARAPLNLYYSDKMVSSVIDSTIYEPENNKLCTLGPRSIF